MGTSMLLCGLTMSYVCSLYIPGMPGPGALYRPEKFSFPVMGTSMLLCGMSVLCKEQGITVIVSEQKCGKSIL